MFLDKSSEDNILPCIAMVKFGVLCMCLMDMVSCIMIFFWLIGSGRNQTWPRAEWLYCAATPSCAHAILGGAVQLWTCGLICYIWDAVPDSCFWPWHTWGIWLYFSMSIIFIYWIPVRTCWLYTILGRKWHIMKWSWCLITTYRVMIVAMAAQCCSPCWLEATLFSSNQPPDSSYWL